MTEKGALIGTTNLSLLHRIGTGVAIEIAEGKLKMEFDDVIKSIPTSNILSTSYKTDSRNKFTIHEIWTTEEVYYIAVKVM